MQKGWKRFPDSLYRALNILRCKEQKKYVDTVFENRAFAWKSGNGADFHRSWSEQKNV